MHRIQLCRPVAVPGAVFPGLAIAATNHGERLFAADFSHDRIDVFGSSFRPVKLASWQFRDARLPKGYFPFNVQALNGNIFVAYDTSNPVTHEEGTGAGVGVVDEFSTDGRLIARVATGLWALVPGTATTGGTGALWFTAGINQEKDGLLGVLRP